MSEGIPVWVCYRADRDVFTLRWNDPRTGKRCQKVSRAKNRKDAYKEAGALQEELAATGGQLRGESKSNPTWDAFTVRYKASKLGSTSRTNRYKWTGIVAVVDAELAERKLAPAMLSDITPELLESVQQRLLARGNKPATAVSAINTLMGGLNWAASIGLMQPVAAPKISGREETDEDDMRGRPITTEEFERILAQCKKLKRIANWSGSWNLLLRGLWLGGLRLGEALNLHESRTDLHRPVNLQTKRPAIEFSGKLQKNRRNQTVAIAPEFAELLRSITPVDGFYFNPRGLRGRYQTTGSAGRVIGELGELAGVVVGTAERPGEDGATETYKLHATAHDLRRSFARRWASRVMPPILQHLMRHRSIETTMKFYVGRDADSAAIAIREGWERSGGADGQPLLCDQVCDQLISDGSRTA